MDKPFGTGAIHQEDTRDFKYAGIAIPEKLPESYRTDTSMFPVLNQKKQESCVSHAAVRLLQIYWYKKTGKIINFSPRFLHAYTSADMADDDGRDPRVIFSTLVKVGCCTVDLLPNDVSLSLHDYSFVPITQAMLDEAAQYRIPAYSFVQQDKYSIRHAIYHKGAVAHLFRIGSEWWLPSWSAKDINPLRTPQSPIGGHEVVGEHWSDTLEGIENSWSSEWNELGYAEYDISNYAPVQCICIDDPNLDFNPDLEQTIKQEEAVVPSITDPTVRMAMWNLIISQIRRLFGVVDNVPKLTGIAYNTPMQTTFQRYMLSSLTTFITMGAMTLSAQLAANTIQWTWAFWLSITMVVLRAGVKAVIESIAQQNAEPNN